ncbi:MAG: DUF2851 family protein [Verrucomicrobiota bacterium]|nr:DUF2851 family protein [Verrucomicrobiota bacterium]
MSSAERYQQLRERRRINERALLLAPRSPNELELQARWFAGDFGRQFRTECGKQVEVVQFGTWNREAGPDFDGASIRIDDGEILRGSIEFDLADRNWESHGHSVNRAFDDTVLHVFVQAGAQAFFTRTSAHRNVLQVRVDPATLPDAFAANVPLARPGRCQAPLRGLPEDRVSSVVEAAARFRLQRKAARLRMMSEAHGADEALFQELAAALGYKQNKLPFTILAQRLPLAFLRANSADAEALLFGVAGFLHEADLAAYNADTRGYVRALWDRWWRRRDEMQRLILPADLWRLGGARPMNHPQRRLGALAALGQNWPRFLAALNSAQPLAATRAVLLELAHAHWSRHYTLTSAPIPKQMALVGSSRVAEMLANVVLPFLSSRGVDVWADYSKLPAQLSNLRLETGATRLFGDDPRRRAFVRTVAQQQGLLQIYEDFCLQDNSDCAHCPFPEQMQTWV